MCLCTVHLSAFSNIGAIFQANICVGVRFTMVGLQGFQAILVEVNFIRCWLVFTVEQFFTLGSPMCNLRQMLTRCHCCRFCCLFLDSRIFFCRLFTDKNWNFIAGSKSLDVGVFCSPGCLSHAGHNSCLRGLSHPSGDVTSVCASRKSLFHTASPLVYIQSHINPS